MRPETDSKIETVTRMNLARVLESDIAANDLDLDADMAGVYGLTSLNKVLFLMSACDDAGVSLTRFTEPDVAGMTTLRDVTKALTRHAGEVA
ncbi:acyl carrier protein [Streptomyces sp. NPDC059096]|uniref:acyl carrier protein n=1 Tax=Streptomyces sp. NPDC059096 TaxID=3346727 RepID=UPI0036B8FA7B